VANVSNYFAHKYKAGSSGTPKILPPSKYAGAALGHEGTLDELFSQLEVDVTAMKSLLPHLG